MSLPAAFQVLRELPAALRWTTLFYLCHILCQGWIGSSQIFLGLSLIALFISLARKELTLRFHALYIPLAVFLFVSVLSTLVNPNSFGGLFEISELFTFATFPLALAIYRQVIPSRQLGVAAFAALATFQALYGVIQYISQPVHDLEHRITGTAAHVMTYSGILLAISLLFIALAIDKRHLWYAAVAAITTIAMILTLTRGAWIGWGAGFLAIIALKKPRWSFYLVPLFLLAITLSPMTLFARLVSTFDVKQSSNLDRIRMAQAGLEIIKDQPLFGVGPGRVKETYPLYREHDAPRFRVPHLHNNFVQLWAERGILAVASYIALVALFAMLCFRARKRQDVGAWGIAGLAIVSGLTFAGLFEFNFGDSEVQMNMLDLLALVAAVLEDGREG